MIRESVRRLRARKKKFGSLLSIQPFLTYLEWARPEMKPVYLRVFKFRGKKIPMFCERDRKPEETIRQNIEGANKALGLNINVDEVLEGLEPQNKVFEIKCVKVENE